MADPGRFVGIDALERMPSVQLLRGLVRWGRGAVRDLQNSVRWWPDQEMLHWL
jgi:hypothetical protein